MANFLRGPCDHMSSRCTAINVPQKNEKWILLATILGSSMGFIDGTIVNVALPAIQEALHASISQMQWVIEAYALTLASLLLVGGALGDLRGQRIVFVMGIVIFTLASAACGMSSTIWMLIIARAIQGIGASLLVPGSLALITISFPEEKRGQAIGTWAGFTAITSAAGPVLGGWLVQQMSWRWIFFLNLPLALIVLIVTIIWVPESQRKQNQKLDIKGAILATFGLGAIIFGLIEWRSGGVIVIVIETLGILALAAFFIVEIYAPWPMVPLKLFKSRHFSGANLITFFLYFPLYGVLFFLPLYMIQVQGYTAIEAGAAFLPVILLIFLLSRKAGELVKQFSARWPLIIGPAISAMGYGLFLNLSVGHSYWTSVFPGTMILGLGMAVSIAPLTTTVMNSVSSDHVGAASGINNAISRIAGLMAVAILGLLMTKSFNYHLAKGLQTSSVPFTVRQEVLKQSSQLADIKTHDENTHQLIQESFIAGYKLVIWIAVALALASSLSAAVFIKDRAQNDSG